MSVIKEKMTELIQAQPEDSSFDEILRQRFDRGYVPGRPDPRVKPRPALQSV